MMNGINDELILAARLLLATLFLIFGWRKVRDYSGTVDQMVQLGLPTAGPGDCRIDLHGSFRSRSRSLLAHSHVPRPRSWLYTRSELRLSGIVIGQ